MNDELIGDPSRDYVSTDDFSILSERIGRALSTLNVSSAKMACVEISRLRPNVRSLSIEFGIGIGIDSDVTGNGSIWLRQTVEFDLTDAQNGRQKNIFNVSIMSDRTFKNRVQYFILRSGEVHSMDGTWRKPGVGLRDSSVQLFSENLGLVEDEITRAKQL